MIPAVCPVAVQLEANVEIRIRADIAAVRVLHAVRVAARGDVVVVRGRQGARSSGENDCESNCGFGEHGVFLMLIWFSI
jgi:hypothetical protein